MKRKIFLILLIALTVAVLQADLAGAGFVMSDIEQMGLAPFDFQVTSSELLAEDQAISFQFHLNYDADLFVYNGYTAGADLPGMLVVNDLNPGLLYVAYADAAILTGVYDLITLNLEPVEPCETTVTMTEARYNNTDIFDITGGMITVVPYPELDLTIADVVHQGLTPFDVTVSSNDISVEDGIVSYQFEMEWDGYMIELVDYSWDEDLTGELVANTTEPGIITVAYAGYDPISGINELLNLTFMPVDYGSTSLFVGNIAFNNYIIEEVKSNNMTIYPGWEEIQIELSGADVFIGDQFVIDVMTSQLMLENEILSFQFILNYDSTLMEYVGQSESGDRLDDLVVNATVPGVIQVAYANSDPLVIEGTLIGFIFNAIADGVTQITMPEFVYNNTYISNFILPDITITNPNHPPVAVAGEDFGILEGEVGMLDGSGSYDPDSDEITYLWTGDLELDDPTAINPVFTAPEVEADTMIPMTLTVDDGEFIGTDEVMVTITNVPNPADAVISMADQDVVIDEEFSVEVFTTPLNADFGVISYQYILSYDPEVLVYSGFDNGAGMPEGLLAVNGEQPGILQVAFSSPDAITNPEYLTQFTFTGISLEETELQISDFYYNNTAVVNTTPAVIVVHEPYYFTGVYVENEEAGLDIEFTCDVMTEELLADWAIISYQFDLYYDPEMLDYEGYQLGDVPAGGNLLSYQPEPGHLSVAFADYNALSGAGSLAGFNFIPLQLGSTDVMIENFKYNAVYLPNVSGGTIDIVIPYSGAVISAPELTVGGGETFTVGISTSAIEAEWGVISFQFDLGFDAELLDFVGYNNGSMINSGNLLAYENAAGNVAVAFADFAPISGEGTLIELEFTAAMELDQSVLDIENFKYNSLFLENINDGLVTIIEPYTDAVITCSDADTREGLNFTVGISTTEIMENWGVISFQFNVGFDSDYVDYVGYQAGEMITSGNLLAFENAEGNISIAFADYMSLSGVGNLIELEFTALLQGETTLDVNQFKYNSLYLENLVDGTVTIDIGNYIPIANAGEDQTVYEGDEVTLDGTLSYDPDDFLRQPDWQFNPPDYEYNGFIWGKVEVNGVSPEDLNDMIGVFVGDECRGIAQQSDGSVQNYIEYFGYYAFMPQVFSNLTSGEIMTFKFYDASADMIYDVEGELPFEADMTVGEGNNPYIFAVTADPTYDLIFNWLAPDDIVLDDPSSPTPSFTAPWVDEETNFVFGLEVSDGQAWSEIDEVTITVLDHAITDVVVSAPQLEADEDAMFIVPVTTTMLQPDMNIISYQFSFSYDPAVVAYTGYYAGALSPNMLVVNNAEPGLVNVAYAGSDPLIGEGELLSFIFTASEGGVSVLGFDYFKYNNVYVSTIDGQIEVIGVNDPPVFNLPDAINFNEDETLTVDFSQYITDPDNDEHTIIFVGNTNINISVLGYDVTMSAPANWFGTEVVTFIVNDNAGREIAFDTAMINVLSVNDAPVLDVPPLMYFDEDGEMIFDIGMYASDVDNDELLLYVTGMVNLEVAIDGLVATITGAENWNGEELLTFTVDDQQGRATASDDCNFIVEPVNDAPVLDLPLSISFDEDTELVFDVSLYAEDMDYDQLSIVSVEYEEENLYCTYSNMEIIFSSFENWNGNTEVTVTITDGVERVEVFDIMTVAVLPVNDPPEMTLTEDYSFDEDGSILVDISSFVTDIESDELSISSVEYNEPNLYNEFTGLEITFTAADNWYGSTEVTVTVTDNVTRDYVSDTMIIEVLPVNDAPLISLPDGFFFNEDEELTVDISSFVEDYDPDDIISIYSVNDPEENLFSTFSGFEIYFSAADNWYGTTEVTVTITDNVNRDLASDTFIIDVLPVNDAPELDLPSEMYFDEDDELIFNIGDYAFDVDGDELELTVTGMENLNVEIAGLIATITGADDWNGEEVLEFTVDDMQGRAIATDNCNFVVAPTNDAPTLDLPEYISFNEDEELIFDVTPYADDIDFDVLDVASVDYDQMDLYNSFNGLVINFSAAANWFGITEVTVTITDNVDRAIASDVIIVEVLPVNDAPEINLPVSIDFDEDTIEEVDFSQYLYDVDMDELILTVAEGLNVHAAIADFMVTFTADENWNGEEELEFTINDQQNRAIATDILNVIVNPVNDAPTLDLPEYISFNEDEELIFDVTPYADDIDFDVLDVASVDYDQGELYNSFNGLIINFSAAEDWFGITEVTVTITDNVDRAIASDVITVEVLSVNDAPEINLPESISFNEDESVEIDFTPFLYDVDMDELILTVEEGVNVHAAIADFMVTFTADENWNGEEELLFTINDQQNRAIDMGTLNVIVIPVNDAPVITEFVPIDTQLTYSDTTLTEFGIQFIDIEDDTEITWYFNDNLLPGINTPEFPITFDRNGEFTVKVQVSDADYTVETSWNILVWMGPDWQPVQYPSSTLAYTRVTIDGLPSSELDMVGAFVGGELRGWSHPNYDEEVNMTFATMLVYGVQIEEIDFIIYDYSANEFYDLYETFTTSPGGEIGTPPNFINLAFGSGEGPNWTPVIYTNSTIVYGVVQIEGLPAEEGDRVGAFVGPECRAVADVIIMDRNSAVVTLLVQGSVPEIAHFKVWDYSADQILSVPLTIVTNPGGEIGYPPNQIIINATESSTITQNISLQTGWNLISLNVYPDSYLIENLFADLIEAEELIKVKNIFNSYDPDLPSAYNTLTEFEDGSGYYVKVANNTTLSVEGLQVNVNDTDIALTSGWNLTGYLPQVSQDLEVALDSILPQLLKIKDSFGSYDPSLPPEFNTLTIMTPGSGYWIKMATSAVLTYPDGLRAVEMAIAPACPVWRPVIYTNSTIAYGHASWNGLPAEGFIGAFAGEECRAVAAIDNGIVSLVINGTENEAVSFKLYNNGMIYESSQTFSTDPGNDVSDLAIYFTSGDAPLVTKLADIYPNPFNPQTTISYELSQAGNVSVDVYNIKGQKVDNLINQHQDAGEYQLIWNANQQASGVYFLRFQASGHSETRKVILMK
ncbi:MAG: tandem-95 repeat protein [Candidatus Cloacimonetes bacterium]|nr:tandem-95 repeat protein [Candidatus Cloacimonadota bacterium]